MEALLVGMAVVEPLHFITSDMHLIAVDLNGGFSQDSCRIKILLMFSMSAAMNPQEISKTPRLYSPAKKEVKIHFVTSSRLR